MATMTPSALISLRAVSKVYGSASPVTALDSVTLDIVPGELAMIMGPSGSGKTTLLSVMGCMLRPSRAPCASAAATPGLGEAELPRVRLNCIGSFSRPSHLFSTLTARGNIENRAGVEGHPRRRGAYPSARSARPSGPAGRQPHTRRASGGQARVAIARALATSPIILATSPRRRSIRKVATR